jgi:DNA invertase Pin-like site-specific DNA recombinase
MRALVQTRVSLDKRGDARSTDEQEAECRAWADRQGWTIAKVITETGSASRYGRSTGARSRWGELTDELRSGQYDILLSWEASRATRELSVYTALRDLCAETGVLWGYSGTVFDLTQRSDRFRTGLDALLSEDESDRISERIRRSTRARAAIGAPHGKIPYGHRREYDTDTGALLRQVPDETTAPIVREIFHRIADGEGLHSIAKDLTGRRIAPPRPARSPRAADGQAWLPSTVKRIATNPTHAGKRTHKGEVVGDAAWPALVEEGLFDSVQGILSDPGRLSRRGDSRVRHLLSGIARCGACEQGPMRVLNNRGRKAYSCLWCQRVTRVVEPVDRHVEARVVAALAILGAQADPTDAHGSAELDEARAELEALRARLEGFTDEAADGGLSPKALAKIEARLTPQIRALETKVRALSVPARLRNVNMDDPQAWWDGATLEERRALLREAFTVTILPAGRGRRTFNPDLVVVDRAW